MKIKTIIIVLGMLLLIFSIRAQDIKPLSIGDTVPDLVLHNVINYKDSVIRLSDFKDKLVILDFWSSTCTSCIELFSEMNNLQLKYGEQILVLLVNAKSKLFQDNQAKISNILATYEKNNNRENRLPVLLDNPLLDNLFPFRSLPHEIWIAPRGRIFAITGAKALTDANIEKALTGKKYAGTEKKDILDFKSDIPLLFNTDNRLAYSLLHQETLLPAIPGAPTVKLYKDDSLFSRMAFINMSLLDMYQALVHLPSFRNNLILNVKDSMPFMADYTTGRNIFSYELLMPKGTPEKQMKIIMRKGLDNRFGVQSRTERREAQHLLLKNVTMFPNKGTHENNKGNSATIFPQSLKDSLIIKNQKPESAAKILSITRFLPFGFSSVTNGIKNTSHLNFSIPATAFASLGTLNKSLYPYNLILVPTRGTDTFFIIESIPNSNDK